MFNNSTWTTINEDGNLEVLNPNEKALSYDRMKELEKYTDYDFSTSDKAAAFFDDLSNEANKTFENIGSSVRIGATTVKYLAIGTLAVVSYLAIQKVSNA